MTVFQGIVVSMVGLLLGLATSGLAEAQSADEPQEPTSSAEGNESDKRMRYAIAIAEKIHVLWRQPSGSANRLRCVVEIEQDREAIVQSWDFVECNGNRRERRSIADAIENASPLPLPDDPALFEGLVRITFAPTEK